MQRTRLLYVRLSFITSLLFCALIATTGGEVLAASRQNTLLPPTQTSCPAPNHARPAVFSGLTVGKHATLVYIDNTTNSQGKDQHGTLVRYDSVTHQKQKLVSSGSALEDAVVSPDGKWVLFVSLNASYAPFLQLVRIDGKMLQTLECFSSTQYIGRVTWSPDQKTVLLDVSDSVHETILKLDLASGKQTIELQAPLGPQAYQVLNWLDNQHAYVSQNIDEAPNATKAPTLYLLDVVHNKHTNGQDLHKVYSFPQNGVGVDADHSIDRGTLYVSYCAIPNTTATSWIGELPAKGGKLRILYNHLQGCVENLETISSTKLLFTIRVSGGDFGTEYLETAKTDGSGLQALYNNGGLKNSVELNSSDSSPWANVSRDGKLYAFTQVNSMAGTAQLILGPLAGGKTTQILSTQFESISVAGWTTF